MKLKFITAIIFTMICTQVYSADSNTQQSMVQNQTAATDPAEQNKQEGEAFLKANMSKKDVVTLKDGLQYKIIKAGKGPTPGANDTVTVDYAGRFIDGTEFDNSAKHGGPVNFTVGQVIPGWVEALQLMPVGSTWEIYVPANLAYGSQGAPGAIGPNKTLIFKVSLIDFKKNG